MCVGKSFGSVAVLNLKNQKKKTKKKVPCSTVILSKIFHYYRIIKLICVNNDFLVRLGAVFVVVIICMFDNDANNIIN